MWASSVFILPFVLINLINDIEHDLNALFISQILTIIAALPISIPIMSRKGTEYCRQCTLNSAFLCTSNAILAYYRLMSTWSLNLLIRFQLHPKIVGKNLISAAEELTCRVSAPLLEQWFYPI